MGPDNSQTTAQRAVDRLLLLDEHQLYEELSVRVRLIALDPEAAGKFDLDVGSQGRSMGLAQNLRGAGKYLFDRLSRPAFDLVCGASQADAGERGRVTAAFDSGEAAVAGAMAEGLVTTWGIAPAVASVVGALGVKLFFQTDQRAMCLAWKKRVPSRRAAERATER